MFLIQSLSSSHQLSWKFKNTVLLLQIHYNKALFLNVSKITIMETSKIYQIQLTVFGPFILNLPVHVAMLHITPTLQISTPQAVTTT